MANSALFTLSSIEEKTLTTPTATQLFPLGAKITVQEPLSTAGAYTTKEYIYVKAASALTQYRLYEIDYSSTAAAEVTTTTPASSSSVYRSFGVAPVGFTSGYYGWLQVKGEATVRGDGTCTAGNAANVINGKVTLTDAGSASITSVTIGMCLTGGTGAGNYVFNLFGERATVA